MVILGLGSNVGDRLSHLQKALNAIKQIAGMRVLQVSPIYLSDALLPDNAPPEWDMPHLNLAIRCETTLEPLDLLDALKNIEWSIGRKPEVRHWGPRILDIDILAWDDRIIQNERLTVPHTNLQERPFALWPLADVAPFWRFPLPGPNAHKTAAEMVEQWGSRFSGEAPLHTRQLNQRIDTPALVGILNITPDSFSDGGCFLNVDDALQQAINLVNSGAEVIDIGAESTAPNAPILTPELEWQRLEPILQAFQQTRSPFCIPPHISVDTRHADVAAKAIDLGTDWINDVTGLQAPAMREIIAQRGTECVVMHHLSIPASREHVLPRDLDPMDVIYTWATKQLELLTASGIAAEKIILDPGIGFGKTPEQSLRLIKHIGRFADLGCRLLVGHSRKSFLSQFTGVAAKDRDVETVAITLFLAKQPVHYLRVHQVDLSARALKVSATLDTVETV